MIMESSFCWLMLLVGGVTAAQLHENENPPFVFDANYYHLYLKFEEVLMKEQDSLEGLRIGFLSDNDTSSVTFKLKIIVDNITDNPYSGAAFCPVGPNSTYFFYWYLCPECLDSVTFSPQPVSDLDVKGSTQMDLISPLIIVLSLIHGNLLSIYIPHYPKFDSDYFYDGNELNADNKEVKLKLKMDYLSLNPSYSLARTVVKELLSWVSHYT